MSDNLTLVERLRNQVRPVVPRSERTEAELLAMSAADRIEALERELAERTRERDESDAVIYDQFREDDLPPPYDLPLDRWVDQAIARHRASRPSASDQGKE